MKINFVLNGLLHKIFPIAEVRNLLSTATTITSTNTALFPMIIFYPYVETTFDAFPSGWFYLWFFGWNYFSLYFSFATLNIDLTTLISSMLILWSFFPTFGSIIHQWPYNCFIIFFVLKSRSACKAIVVLKVGCGIDVDHEIILGLNCWLVGLFQSKFDQWSSVSSGTDSLYTA